MSRNSETHHAETHSAWRKRKRDFRMESFAKEYAVDVNGRQAAIRVDLVE
jgi:hypothetical protein